MGVSEDLAIVDLSAALARLGGDRELLREIAGLFLEQQDELLSRIREAVTATDGPALERAAHVLKGAVANFGAQRAAELAFRLEKAGRESAWQGVESTCGELQAVLEKLVAELEAWLKFGG
jgi:HPt (histidine-containing phosphotransfer) domain-containing protein